MADIRAAAKALHDSRQALPEDFRGTWGLSPSRDYVVPTSNPARYVVAHANFAAEHIARSASPDVTEAVADLLSAIADALTIDDDTVQGYAEALAAAILREV